MSNGAIAIREYFVKLGLAQEIADIYSALHTYGRQTISELARNSGVERTRIYRLLDELQATHLIEVEVKYKRTILSAAPITNLHILLTKKEEELQELHSGLHTLQQTIAQNSLQSPTTKIQSYSGSEGLKQMFWNQTRSKTENISILYENMQTRTKKAFFERWAQACNERRLHFRSIVGDNFVHSQQQWYKKHSNERLTYWQGRYIDDDIFPITHSMVVYDDTTAYFNWKDDEVFGIEIHNMEIAAAQRRFFEMLWEKGKEVKKPSLPS